MPPTQPVTARPVAARPSVAAAFGRGGVTGPIGRGELRALLRGVADAQSLIGANGSGSRLASSDGLADAEVRDGVAILCPRRPVLLHGIEPIVRLTYLSEPVAAGPDGSPVDTLFLILANSATAHDGLLAALADLLDDSFLALLAERAPYERLAGHLVDAANAAPADVA